MSQRNFALDALKLLLACCIVMLHFDWRIIPRGYLSVEFFFVISGFLIYQTRGYLKYNPLKPIKRIYPIYLLSIVTILVFSSQAYDLWSILLSFLMLQSLGLNDEVINVPSWFLCVYLVSMPLLAYIIKKTFNKKSILISICSVISVLSYFILYTHTPSTGFNYSFEYKVFGITVGLWRCWAGLCLGVVAAALSENIGDLKFKKATIIEASLLFFFVIVFCFSGWSANYDYISLPLVMISVVMWSKHSGMVSKGMSYLFEKSRLPSSISTNIFLLHFPVIMIMSEANDGDYEVFYLVCTLIIAVTGMLSIIKKSNKPPHGTS